MLWKDDAVVFDVKQLQKYFEIRPKPGIVSTFFHIWDKIVHTYFCTS